MGSPLRQPLSSTGCDWLTGRQPLRRVDRHRVFFVSSAIVLAALLFPSLGGCDYQAKREVPDPPAVVRQTEAAPIVVDGAKLAKNVQSFCGDCHAPPKAESFSKGQWPREVRRGFEFYTETGRADLTIPREDDVLKYYVDQAPETLPLPQTYPLDRVAEKQFVFTQSAAPRDLKEGTAGANIVSFDWGPPLGQMMMMSDMRNGSIFACGFNGEGFDECKIVAKLQHPCRLVQCDLDGSGQQGLLVSELGSFLPADHALGRVVWFRRNSETELTFDKEVLLRGCGRIADAQAVDLDQDGDLDITVADFGWHKTGRILWLERIASGPVNAASFVTHIIDERPGALQVPAVDINGDGRLDIVALIAQESEAVVAFLNDGKGGFHPTTLYTPADPAYGSSGMELCDLDQDGDIDILYTNGDSFDSYKVKPYHGVRWLENQGELKFLEHELAKLPGAHRAVPSDLDQDGDLDIVACSFLPGDLISEFKEAPAMAIIWLENLGDQKFVTRPLQVDGCIHPALCVDDYNDDGIPDIAAANFYEDASKHLPAMDILLATGVPLDATDQPAATTVGEVNR